MKGTQGTGPWVPFMRSRGCPAGASLGGACLGGASLGGAFLGGASPADDAATAMYHIDGVTESGAVPNGC
jgi:hypothetical protein